MGKNTWNFPWGLHVKNSMEFSYHVRKKTYENGWDSMEFSYAFIALSTWYKNYVKYFTWVFHVESHPWSYHMFLPMWHENSTDFFTWKLMESPWKISCVFHMEFRGAYNQDPHSAGTPTYVVMQNAHTKIHTRMWCGRNRNCRFKFDFSIRSLSVITSCSHTQFANSLYHVHFVKKHPHVTYVSIYTAVKWLC